MLKYLAYITRYASALSSRVRRSTTYGLPCGPLTLITGLAAIATSGIGWNGEMCKVRDSTHEPIPFRPPFQCSRLTPSTAIRRNAQGFKTRRQAATQERVGTASSLAAPVRLFCNNFKNINHNIDKNSRS